MVFSSLLFLIFFLPITLGIYYFLPKNFRNYWLLLSSLIFYAYSGLKFLLIFIGECIVNWFCGLMIFKTSNRSVKRTFLFSCIIIDLCILFIFKYFSFAVFNINELFHTTIPISDIVLPVGISFYTFQGLSYVIDVYRGAKSEKNPFYLSMYLSFFPQLIAGPIVRYQNISAQIYSRTQSLNGFTSGIRRFCIGFIKKILLANQLGTAAAFVFDNSLSYTFCSPILWIGAVAYTLQIFLDFSAYSDMAIGLGMMFGFSLPENFDTPYLAGSAVEFWRKWHMTLSSWFRDYVYIPLGGNRGSSAKTIMNLLIVWVLTGIWHGAGWNYLLWGFMWFLLISAERFLLHPESMSRFQKTVYRCFFILFVIVSWMVFRTSNIGESIGIILTLFNPASWSILPQLSVIRLLIGNYYLYFVFGILVSVGIPNRIILKMSSHSDCVAIISDMMIFVLSVLAVSFLVGESYNPFLYFQF